MSAIAMTYRPEMTSDPLAPLVDRVTLGSQQALRTLLEAVTPTVLAIARVTLGPAHPDLEDVAQDILLAVVKGLPAFRRESSVNQYVRQIAVRRSVDALRAARRQLWIVNDPEEGEAPSSPSSAGPDQSLARARARKLWRRLLTELPAAQSEALVLRVVLGYSVEEIAEATGAGIETVRSRLRLAKKAIRERIEREPELADLAVSGEESP
jgi:RNA polymerase sigma-70 factor (ECF subfamily)